MPFSPQQKLLILEAVKDDPIECALLQYDWRNFNARENQVAPDWEWFLWFILAGRGFGKTRAGGEWVREKVEAYPGARIALVGPTAADVRDTMVEGESGILACSPPWAMPRYEPSKRRLTWPNGTIATCFSAEEPERLRGPQHHFAWGDELCAWFRQKDTWDQLMFGLRLPLPDGRQPQVIVTTTPKPQKLIKELLQKEGTAITRGSTHENKANLAPSFYKQVVDTYNGTRLGRQEINAEILDDNPNALWKLDDIAATREDPAKVKEILARCSRIVIGVDPAVSSNPDSDDTGIVVAGIDRNGHDAYVFADNTLQGTPLTWAKAVDTSWKAWQADRVVAEVNNGGDLVEINIRNVNKNLAYTAVHASRGKTIRAEPVAALYEQHRVHHVGVFDKLETEITEYNPTLTNQPSPNRMDALVWALSFLFNITIVEPKIRRL